MSEYRTFEGYERQNKNKLTKCMEDYLEMICRLGKTGEAVRVSRIAFALNVKASSVTKMVKLMAKEGLIVYNPYDCIRLTPEGEKKGNYLIHRHNVIFDFLCFINGSTDELEQTELIEHHLNKKTVQNIEKLLNTLKKD